MKRVLGQVVRVPFAKGLLQRVSEMARGKCIVYFSLHRIIDREQAQKDHPHFLNKTAITKDQAKILLSELNKKLPFISLADSISCLKGEQSLSRSHGVLLIEVPYVQTLKLLSPILLENQIPATIVLDTESLSSGQMPWMDDIVYRFGSTDRPQISVDFMDRSFALASPSERMAAANHMIDYLNLANPAILRARLEQLRACLDEVAIPPMSERILTTEQLAELGLDPMFSFMCAGQHRLPFCGLSHQELDREIGSSKKQLNRLFGAAAKPVFFCTTGFDKPYDKEIIQCMMMNGFTATIAGEFGVCRPGDNMFLLKRMPLSNGVKSFDRYELQGLLNAIDEFLLITLAQERKL